jgi:hypothetical protein
MDQPTKRPNYAFRDPYRVVKHRYAFRPCIPLNNAVVKMEREGTLPVPITWHGGAYLGISTDDEAEAKAWVRTARRAGFITHMRPPNAPLRPATHHGRPLSVKGKVILTPRTGPATRRPRRTNEVP